jgi:hypothetical protein
VHRAIKENLETTNLSDAELNALQCQRRPRFREAVISFGEPGIGEAVLVLRGLTSRSEPLLNIPLARLKKSTRWRMPASGA